MRVSESVCLLAGIPAEIRKIPIGNPERSKMQENDIDFKISAIESSIFPLVFFHLSEYNFYTETGNEGKNYDEKKTIFQFD